MRKKRISVVCLKRLLHLPGDSFLQDTEGFTLKTWRMRELDGLNGASHAILRRERRRLRSMEVYEKEARLSACRWIAGVDEAGRGPLAGPLVAAAVVFEKNPMIPGLRDSKQLTFKEREELYEIILESVWDYGVSIISVEELNSTNMHLATLKALRQAVLELKNRPELVLVDGRFELPGLPVPQRTIIEGDTKSFSIAAASVIAKVTRDRIMGLLHEDYPRFGFKHNKGYATREHLEALKKYGPCPAHRCRFAPVREAMTAAEEGP